MNFKKKIFYPAIGVTAFFVIGFIIFFAPFSDDVDLLSNIDLGDVASIESVNKIVNEKISQKDKQNTFYFGFDLRNGPVEDARQYIPFLDYLRQKTGYNFRLRFFSENTSVIDALGTKHVSFAAIGAVSFIEAQGKYKVINLVRGKNTDNKTYYRSIIVTGKKNSFKSLADLKGKRFAFGSKTSTQGHLIPRIMLQKNGMTIKDFSSYIYTGSHSNCASAVTKGLVDACGMQDTLALSLIKNGDLKQLAVSSQYPSSGIASNPQVPKDVLEKVTAALLDFKPLGRDKAGLYNWQKTEMPNGFGPATSTDYAKLHIWLDKLTKKLLHDKHMTEQP